MSLTAALSLLLLSQATVEPAPYLERLQAALDEAYARRPSLQGLLSLTQGPVAASLEEDLGTHDWLVVGAWSYVDRDPTEYTRFREENAWTWIRYLPDGRELRSRWSPGESIIHHDDAGRASGHVVKVERSRGRTWLVHLHEGERQYIPVVSYAAGVLVLDVTRGGTPSSRKVEFRAVRVAVPRLPGETGR
ncbi:MAG: hypothetical protein RL653_1003 [Pseudomonadota bacterium]|jgi:hypothetical protein